MTVRFLVARVLQQDRLNFALTNRIPRRLATRLMGWFSKVERPVIRDISIAIWRFFCDVDLSDAKKTKFVSLHDCFIRELREGSRPLDQDPNTLVSPCDAIVGTCGAIAGTVLMQVKGSGYELEELLVDRELADFYRGGCYVTLRLTAGMYHRFHAPHDCLVEQITHIWGDAWNVNPIALRRIERLYCKNERVVIRTMLQGHDQRITRARGRHPRCRHSSSLPGIGRGSEAIFIAADPMPSRVPQGPRDGMVRAWIYHHCACPSGFRPARKRLCWCQNPHGRVTHAAARGMMHDASAAYAM